MSHSSHQKKDQPLTPRPIETLSSMALFLLTMILGLGLAAPAAADCPDRHWSCANGSKLAVGTCYRFPSGCFICHDNWQDGCRARDVRCDGGQTPAARMDGCSAPDIAGGWRDTFKKACNEHDACYTTPSRTKDDCDSDFFLNMSMICGQLPGATSTACFEMAAIFKGAVSMRHEAQEGYDGDQKWARENHCGNTGGRKLVFDRAAGRSAQQISYWAGSSLPRGGGGPVPSFVNPPQPAWIDLQPGGSHTIHYSDTQPTQLQTVFFNIIKDNQRNNAVCVVSMDLNGNGTLTKARSNCPASISVRTEQDRVVVGLPTSL